MFKNKSHSFDHNASSTFGSVYHFSGSKITGHFRDVDISIRYVAECPTRIFHDFAKALKVEIKMSNKQIG
ncbi:MAG: hypothetical protein GEU26_09855 [Nitrososphaeraceae archaeon]|nr:hypothetical protein [Nitrososphaeraceae archaeon]